jgi:hypothetical protein
MPLLLSIVREIGLQLLYLHNPTAKYRTFTRVLRWPFIPYYLKKMMYTVSQRAELGSHFCFIRASQRDSLDMPLVAINTGEDAQGEEQLADECRQ